MKQPSLFVSHGAPDLALGHEPARQFLARLGEKLERPDAIVLASAHHEAQGVAVRSPKRFRTWHDFGRGFDPRLFEMRYEPHGSAAVAAEVLRRLHQAGLDPRDDSSDLIDHGAWVPLSLLFPEADIPVVMVSIDPSRDSRWHERVGAALAPLRDQNVLLIGSGSISHNLRAVFSLQGGEDRAWVEQFTGWLEQAISSGDRERLLDTLATAPGAQQNHPTDEHLLPLFFAYGAGGGSKGERIHHSFTYGVLAMDGYAFGDPELLEGLRSDREMAEHRH